MSYRVKWTEDLTFEGSTPEGLKVTLDASPEFGGKGRGPRPAEILLLGLGGCTGMDVISILKKKRAQVESMEMEIDAERSSEHPKVFTKISLTYVFKGKDLKEEDIKRAIELSTEKYCVVGAMLKKACPIEYNWRIE
ncbi:MAG: OsmC family protein [Candidatus Glassbacteria bacterium]